MDPSNSEIPQRDTRWMQRALALAATAAAVGEVPVGAVVVCKDSTGAEQELSFGVNTRERDSDPCGHAEVNALRAAAAARGHWRLDGCTLYVTLEPCAMCAGAIVLARIDRVVYAAADPKGGFCGTLGDLSAWPGLNHRFAVTGGVCRDEAAAQLRGFFAALRRDTRSKRTGAPPT
ncbi:MAG: nucleoside deaminase [Myxococcota bacterium]